MNSFVLILIFASISIISCYIIPKTNHRYYRYYDVNKKIDNRNSKLEASKLSSFLESQLLDLTSDTDRGNDITQSSKQEAREIMKALGAGYERNALQDPRLYGNFEVAYVDSGDVQEQRGNPAGGGFRGNLAKFIYNTDGIYQHILKNPTGDGPLIVNYVSGVLFGLIPLAVILRGVARKLAEKEKNAISKKYNTVLSEATVRANFEPPLLAVGSRRFLLPVRIGPQSSVVLDTPYLSNSVRLGVGSRGSLFAFTRTEASKSDQWKIAFKTRAVRARRLGFALFALTLLLWRSGTFIGTKTPAMIIRRFISITTTTTTTTNTATTAAFFATILARITQIGLGLTGMLMKAVAGVTAFLGALLFTKGGILE